MDFYEVLANVIQLLQREGRASYRALKRQFSLDDDYLEDLKDAMLYAYPQVIDDGRGLVWTDDIATHTASISTPPSRQPAAQHDQLARAAPPPDAERRQLTVMFCDLADSTRLAGQLDPEDLRNVIRTYQAVSTRVIARFDGYVAQHLGDGLMVYFGWPQAHEDDPQRAVRAGLGLLEVLAELHDRLRQEYDIQLAVRIGIHTGRVVVGEIGQGARQEHLALGETPNIASRLEGIARPNTVIISRATYRLVEGYFDCRDLGSQTLKGVAIPLGVYQVLRDRGIQSRLEATGARDLTPLVGRAKEVDFLTWRWTEATCGRGQVVLVHGEAAIGKSRLAQELFDRIKHQGGAGLTLRCTPYTQQSAFHPVIEHLHRLLQFVPEDSPPARFTKLAQQLTTYSFHSREATQLLAAFLSLPVPEEYPALTMPPQRQKQQTLDTLVAWLLEDATQHPVLMLVEDLHWADASSLELLTLTMGRISTARLFLLLTARPEFRPSWPTPSYYSQLSLAPLSHDAVERIVMHVTRDKTLPAEVIEYIAVKTDGIPLFVEQLTKALLESGFLGEDAERYVLHQPLVELDVPATLHDSLMARLDRLDTAKGIAQLGATIGRQFSYALLQSIAPVDATTLQHGLERLVEAELISQHGTASQATYTFKHALIQDIAYQSLLRSTRQQMHGRIARVLIDHFSDVDQAQPELIAQHYTQAGQLEAAIPYWHRAGQRALGRSAHIEGIAHLETEIALLKTLPETPARMRQELDARVALGPAFMATKGHGSPETEQSYARARELCHQLGDTPQLVPALVGLSRHYLVRGQVQTARELSHQALILAQRTRDPILLINAWRFTGFPLFHLGHLASSREHFETALTFYDPQKSAAYSLLGGNDPAVVCLSRLGLTLWLLGYPAQALARSLESLALAEQLVHPFSQVWALHFLAWQHHFRCDGLAMRQACEALLAVANEHGFAQFIADGTLFMGWVHAVLDRRVEGVAEMRQGLEAKRTTGANVDRSYQLALLAEAWMTLGQSAVCLQVLDEALAFMETSDERFWEAEIHRLKGNALQALGHNDAADIEHCFLNALDVARQQRAKSLELRAAISLARLWQSQRKHRNASDLLAPVYGWFTEGFDTADLQEAKALLEEL